MNYEQKLDQLADILKKYERAIIAFSGGVDSTFLLTVAVQSMGKDRLIALTASSETYTPAELEFARKTAAALGVEHVVLETSELEDANFASNPVDRCYHCKKEFYSKVLVFSKQRHVPVILDGNNADDVGDYRPGRKAARDFGVLSPLIEAGITKDDIRRYAREHQLSWWDKPSSPCLASRVPYGSAITPKKLRMIEQAESVIRGLGFGIVRVRHHDKLARIELPAPDLARFMMPETAGLVSARLKELGFVWITVDIEGYRMGSLNEVVEKSA